MPKRSESRKTRQKQQRRRQHDERTRWIRVGGLLILAVAALGIFGFYRNKSAPAVDAPTEIMNANVLGPTDAPVRIVEFGDLGCPACRQWHNSGIMQQLLARFEGQINFTFRHFPVITRQSPKAAEAAQCAAEQDRFWQYHDFVYEQTSLGDLSISALKGYAAAVGLNSEQFEQCLDSGKYRDYVARDQSAAVADGARGTPSFYINGEIVDFFYESMEAKIIQELNS
jgi:protein-disulfide isomerase